MIRVPQYRSFYTRFLVLFLPLFFIPLVCIVFIYGYFNYDQAYSRLQEKLNQVALNRAILLSDPLHRLNKDQIKSIIGATITDPDIVFIKIIDQFGDLIDLYGQPPENTQLINISTISHIDNNISSSIGKLTLGVTDAHIAARAMIYVEHGSYIIILLFAYTFFCTRIAQHYSINIPLRSLLQSINTTNNGDLLQPAIRNRIDEMAHVIEAYNALQIRQISYEEEIQKNTTDLTETVETLKKEITEKIEITEALQESEQRYKALYDNNPLILFTINNDCIIQSINQYGAKLLGYEVEELTGKSMLRIFHKDDRETIVESLEGVLVNRGEIYHWNLRNVHKDGSIIWVRETVRAIQNKDGKINIFIISENITEARILTEQLTHQASHDSLTNLVNRGEFERRLKRVLKSAKSNDTEHALCYMDLDQFKVINDTYGHIAGDELLRQLSQLLHDEIRQRDTLARLGGDEFGLLMEHCSLSNALQTTENIRKTIQSFQFIWENKHFNIGVSIGLVIIDNSSNSTTDLMKTADTACYTAKNMGGNRVHFYAEDDEELMRHRNEMHWVARIQQALDENRFYLMAQIISPIDKHDHNNHHYELLLRMDDEDGNIVLPGKFLPAAERYGTITKLDRWVINQAFNTIARNPDLINDPAQFSINLSGLSIVDEEFLEYIKTKLKTSKFPANKICFEITETATIANINSARYFIESLKKLGCHFALDDFGSGLSSFAYLKTLPVDYLKIDGFFIKNIANDIIDYTMVKSINDIGHKMGKQIIAEYVEDESILEKLREIGVDYAQGYGIGRPQLLDELVNNWVLHS